MSEALDRGRDGLIRAATRAVLVAVLVAPGCGGDDSMGTEPEPADDASVDVAVRRDSAADISPGREVSVEGAANLDRNVPPEGASANRNDGGDASRDARDAAPGDGGAGDTLNSRDTAPEAPLPEAQAEARPPDAAADRADAADDRAPSNDSSDATSADVSTEVAPVVEASTSDAVEAANTSEPEIESSTGADVDAGTTDAAEANDGSEAGSSLAPQSWVVGSNPVCVTGDPAECQPDPNHDAFLVTEQANNVNLCPMAISLANLWFPPGDAPNPGSYDVLAASSSLDFITVPAGRVVVQLTASNQATSWWGQTGTVFVTSNGGPPTITFDGVTANDGTTDALISGNVPCSP